MASDYGDESGEKMLDNFTRFCEMRGESAMRERAYKLQNAFDHAKANSKAHGAAEEDGVTRVEWAKLDMREFQAIEGYDEVKQVIEAKLRAHGVEPTWFEDKAAGKEYLLFRIVDAQEVWDSFDELSRETETAAERAAEAVKAKLERETGKEAPGKGAQAVEAPEPAPKAPEPAPAEGAAKRRPSHAKTFWQKHDVPVLRDMRPLEERARHARAASAALEAERGGGRARAREPRIQELRSK